MKPGRFSRLASRKIFSFMQLKKTKPSRVLFCVSAGILIVAVIAGSADLRSRSTQNSPPKKQQTSSSSEKEASVEALRLNSLGVAHMNQQKGAEAEKYFNRSLAADPAFAPAKVNLGIALLSQQKLAPAVAALEDASAKLPQDPFAWYNLGIAYKDSGEPEKAIRAFQHVEQIVPDEPDAYYFEGFLWSQLQKFDDAIAAFQKALTIAPYHASAQFGLARAFQRKGDADAAREHMKRFQKITTEHLGAPFGAGYGDQGKYSLAEFIAGGSSSAAAAIPVRYEASPLAKHFPAVPAAGAEMVGQNNGVCLLDYDGDGKTDVFLVSAGKGTSRLLKNLGDGNFEDVTAKSGLGSVGGGRGCAAGDYDNDGHVELAVCEAD